MEYDSIQGKFSKYVLITKNNESVYNLHKKYENQENNNIQTTLEKFTFTIENLAI